MNWVKSSLTVSFTGMLHQLNKNGVNGHLLNIAKTMSFFVRHNLDPSRIRNQNLMTPQVTILICHALMEWSWMAMLILGESGPTLFPVLPIPLFVVSVPLLSLIKGVKMMILHSMRSFSIVVNCNCLSEQKNKVSDIIFF